MGQGDIVPILKGAALENSLAVSEALLATITGVPRATVGKLDLDIDGLAYRILGGDEEHRLADELDAFIETTDFRSVGGEASDIWERGWGEVAERVGQGPVTVDALRPQYFRDERHFRLNGRYVEAVEPRVEYRLSIAVRRILLNHYLADVPSVVELGCGTGLNILLLAGSFAQMRLVGCDWAGASQRILSAMERQFPGRIEGKRLNMLTMEGADDLSIGGDDTVLTVHAMEQLSGNWQACLDFIMAARPRMCLHIEPLLELYDAGDPADARMIRYHRKRGYLHGYLPAVQRLAEQGQAKILELRRTAFSGVHHEAYSVLAWQPL